MSEAKRLNKVRLVLWVFLGTLSLIAMIVYLILDQAGSVKLPESLKKAPIELPDPRPAAGAPARPRPSALPTSPTQFSGINDYLQARLARDPGLESARLYLELTKHFQDEEIYKRISSIFPNTYPDRLSPEQIGWVRGKAGLIAQIQRFSRSGPFPSMATEDRVEALKRTGSMLPEVNFLSFQTCGKLLIAESQLQAQEGNHAAACQAVQDVFSLAGMLQGDDVIISRLILNALAGTANRELTLWIESRDFPKSELAPLLALMERFDAATMLPEPLVRSTAYTYLESRFILVHNLETPTWRSPLYGWDRDQNPRDYESELRLPRMRTSITVPNVAHIVSKAWVAIRNREHSAEALQEYDRLYLKLIESMKRPYPQFIREEEKIMRDIERETPRQFLFREVAMPNYMEYRTRMLAGETWLHLNRVGLGLRLDPQQTRARRSEGFANDPHHPWRDPFTEKPLRIDETTSPTLVWSLGPDLKDQRGMISYDPTNGTVSEGDLVIRVP